MLRRFLLYWHTVRHLRPIQVIGRLRVHLRGTAIAVLPAPSVRKLSGRWVLPARRQPSMTDPMTFSFLGETRRVDGADWGVGSTRLWNYNVHYFDDLNAHAAESRRAWHEDAIGKWVRGSLPPRGPGWDPYPTSLRIVNWVKWVLSGGELGRDAIDSLAMQGRLLERHFEYHLLGNHLFANAKAMVFLGLFFEGDEAGRWLGKGLATLAREIPEQVLPDGGQFERSPMYHALALEDLLDLINLASATPAAIPSGWRSFVASWPQLAQRMRSWLRAMTHPDGEIAFFNDAAMGIAPSPAELERYAGELIGPVLQDQQDPVVPMRLVRLDDSGYYRAEAPGATLMMDVAPIGPDYLPGHAHADTLSFELSLFGERVVVNGGTSRYEPGPVRDAERGTPAHSTVTVGDENSSEVWAGFRVARRARPFELAVEESAARISVGCSHDGYRRLPGRPVHRRSWLLEPGRLQVEDRADGGSYDSVARFHLHPGIAISLDPDGRSGHLALNGGRAVRWRVDAGSAFVEASTFSPAFGRREATRCLSVRLAPGVGSRIELAW